MSSVPIHTATLSTTEFADEPTVVIQPSRSRFQLDLRSLLAHGELLYFLVWRDVKVRYKQTAIGAGWAVIQPLLTMVLFTAVFSGLANVPSEGIPYPVFAYTALLPWTYFSQALGRSGTSLVGNASLITKVYFPRLIIPLSAVISPLVDLAVAFVILIGFIAWFGITPGVGVLALPVFILLCVLTSLAVSLWLSALCVRYRDFGYIIPFLLQAWMYASPVAYPASLVPERFRAIYALNPMVGVIEGFRWGLLGSPAPDLSMIGVSSLMVLVILYGGLVYFKNMERTFADVV
jgi:lipopolysaccharide transport system permease protein